MTAAVAVSRTERGYPGHLVVSRWCVYHRNTLVEGDGQRIVVSSIGHYIPHDAKNNEPELIGLSQYYETKAFRVRAEPPYAEADTNDEVTLDGDIDITDMEFDADFRADAMHEAAVAEIAERIERGEFA